MSILPTNIREYQSCLLILLGLASKKWLIAHNKAIVHKYQDNFENIPKQSGFGLKSQLEFGLKPQPAFAKYKRISTIVV